MTAVEASPVSPCLGGTPAGMVLPAWQLVADACPTKVIQVELEHGLERLLPVVAGATEASSMNALVRLHSWPLGVVRLPVAPPDPATEWARRVWDELGPAIRRHLDDDGWAGTAALDLWSGLGSLELTPAPDCGNVDAILEPRPPSRAPLPPCLAWRRTVLAARRPATVVVATRDRPSRLAACLDALLDLEYPDFEIVVVDNDPPSDVTARLLAERYVPSGRVRYVQEPQRGLAAAHNRGLSETCGEVVAFTDDDVVVDRHWLAELVAPFVADPEVAATTGLILPAELETPAQALLESHGRFAKGFAPQRFDLARHRPSSPMFPFAAGQLGSGASMAFSTAFLRGIGGFDAAIGAGTLARGGDDLAAFFRVIVAGRALVYQPSAVVWHHHHRDMAALERQLYGYGVGLGAYLTSAVVHQPQVVLRLLWALPSGVAHLMRSSTEGGHRPAGWPRRFVNLERRGLLVGPFAYAASRLRCRRRRSEAPRGGVVGSP